MRRNRRVTIDSLTTRPHLHTICHIEYVWTQRSWPGGPPSTHLWRIRWWLQWLKNFLPSMNARNFSERSWPSSKRLKFLRCLRVLQRRPTCSCYVVMPSSRTSTSSPEFFLQCGQLALKVTMWWVLNQRSFKLVSGPSDKLIGWQAHQWLSPSRKKSRPARRRHPRRRLLDLQCWPTGLPSIHNAEDCHTGAALSGWRRKGPSTTLPRKQEVWQAFFIFRNQTTFTAPRWGLAWQTLPRTGGVCWATAGPPASSRTGWALHSSNDLSSPIKASVSGPATADKTFSKPSMPCWWREP